MKSFSNFLQESTDNRLDEFKGKKVQLSSGSDKVTIAVMDSILYVQINNNMVIVDNDAEYKKAIEFFKSV